MEENKAYEPEFQARLDKHYDELKWLYCEIYRNDMQAFNYFIDMLHEYYQARKPELKEWDDGRLLAEEWCQNNVGRRAPPGRRMVPEQRDSGHDALYQLLRRNAEGDQKAP